MDEYSRSRSYGDGRMELESYYGKPTSISGYGLQNLRCYSASYATTESTTTQQNQQITNTQMPRVLKKGKSANGSISSKAGWCFSDPELQRKKRVASYKAYSVEGKIKRSFSKSFRWLKDRYSQMVHG